MSVNPSIKRATFPLLAIYLCFSGKMHSVEHDIRIHKNSKTIYMARPIELNLPCPPEGSKLANSDQLEAFDAEGVIYVKEIIPNFDQSVDFGPSKP
jgi:hypothetical protein